MKIFEKFFIDSQKLELFTKNKLHLKINQTFSDTDRHILDENCLIQYNPYPLRNFIKILNLFSLNKVIIVSAIRLD
jgi:hypothetical protein